jgi:ABC-type uncharacterized transport system substrate-binding protein
METTFAAMRRWRRSLSLGEREVEAPRHVWRAQAEAVAIGGLVSYGLNWNDQFRRVAEYVDRVLNGTRPADLPVQKSTKYQLTLNLKTAQALGLEVPPTLLARADEVIE